MQNGLLAFFLKLIYTPHIAFPNSQMVLISYFAYFLSDAFCSIKTTGQDLFFKLSLIHSLISLSDLALTSSQRFPFNGSYASTTPLLRT